MPADTGGVDVTVTIPPQLADAVDEDDEDDCHCQSACPGGDVRPER